MTRPRPALPQPFFSARNTLLTTMAVNGDSAQTLSELRARIDAIDEEMHRLLVERSSVIDALIAAKGTSVSGVAFRPQREATMMRRIVARHSGNLPLATVEHLWREIISTFTYMQAPFRLVVHYGDDPVAIHDLARFAFGFSVELVRADSPEDVAATVAATGSDLGLVPIQAHAPSPWWRSLTLPNAPRVMAVWPFIAGTGPGTPAIILSPPLADPTPSDLIAFAATDTRAPGTAVDGVAVIAECQAADGRDVLIAVDHANAADRLASAGIVDAIEIGGLATGIALSGTMDVLRRPGNGDPA